VIRAECERQIEIARAFGTSAADFTSLLLVDDDLLCGSVIDRGNVRAGVAASYLTNVQICFGIMERVVGELRLFTLLYMRAYL